MRAQGVTRMQPIGPLMWEHRLIERMVVVLRGELDRLLAGGGIDALLIDAGVDFFRTYADRTHHGKEEDILFRELLRKPLTPEHRRTMDELVTEHVQGRQHVKGLVAAKERVVGGDAHAVDEVRSHLAWLVDFYPLHIAKEDKRFFHPVMRYFDKKELDAMLDEMREFDSRMVHERYGHVVEGWERRPRG